MASSKVARRRQNSLPKEPPASVDVSDSDGEKDSGLDDFEIIKTIGKYNLQVLWCRIIAFVVNRAVSCPISLEGARQFTVPDTHTNVFDGTGSMFMPHLSF
jgi:hypothetical protein